MKHYFVTLCTLTCTTIAAAEAAVSGKAQETTSSLLKDLKGAGWGAGIGTFFTTGDDLIENAAPDSNQILRVTTKSNARISGVLELHYFWNDQTDTPDKVEKAFVQNQAKEGYVTEPFFAHGPMVLAELGENGVRSFGLGYLFSWRRSKVLKGGENAVFEPIGKGLNIGIAALLEPDVRVLADGFEKNKSMPPGRSEVQFDKEARLTFGLLAAYQF